MGFVDFRSSATRGPPTLTLPLKGGGDGETAAAARPLTRLALLDGLADEEMFGHDEQIHDRERFEIVVHQQQVGIVACGQTLALVLNSPSRTLAPNLPFWLFSSNSSLHAVQKKSASLLLLGKEETLALPQCGQYAQALTQASVHARAFCEPLA
jgi:hypothetical protein